MDDESLRENRAGSEHQELHDSAAFAEGLFEASPDAIVVVDTEGLIVRINTEAEAMFGYDRKEVIGRRVELLIPERFRGRHVLHRAGYMADPRTRPMGAGIELFGRRKDGAEFPVDINLAPLRIGGIILFLSTIRDITENKRAQAMVRASLNEKEVLLKEIHHRVKNNLQVISSLLNLQSRYISDSQMLGPLKDSQSRVKSMALVHEQLYRSKDLAEVNFAAYVKSLVNDLTISYGAALHNVKTTVDIKDVFLNIDTAIPCGLIINELISNALKYAFKETTDGQIDIKLRPINGDKFTLVVKDNGVGLPAGFDFQNTSSLGLRLVNSLASQLKGSIELDSNVGTEFRITFSALKCKERM